MGDKNKLYSCP